MKYTLESLMQTVGCEKYPERWSEIFHAAMKEYDEKGCYLTDPRFYDAVDGKYGCFVHYKDVYKEAAIQTASDEALARFLTLLAMALQDEEYRRDDIKEFGRPVTPEGKEPLAYEMVTGLALCSQLEHGAKNMKKRNFSDDLITEMLTRAVDGVRTFERKHNGAHGFDLLSWSQLYIEGKLAMIERLEIEFLSGFSGRAYVFKNKQGEVAVLAHDILLHRDGFALGSLHYEDEEGAWSAYVEETETSWIGHPFREDGFVDKDRVELPKKKWKKVMQRHDPVIRLHIPPKGKMTPEMIDKTIEVTKEFAAQYYPEYEYKAFACNSWLIDPQLDEILNPESNIVKFRQRFHSLNHKSAGKGIFNFIFNKADMNFEIRDLPEDTGLQRALKKHYMNGKAIYEMEGIFF